jgi:hypothetical protein
MQILSCTLDNVIDNIISFNDVENDDKTSVALLNRFNEKLREYEE